jgi:hypothetical protein
MKNFIKKNWKTSLAGVCVAVSTFLKSKEIIDEPTFILVFGILTSIGLFAAKDGDQTGLSK